MKLILFSLILGTLLASCDVSNECPKIKIESEKIFNADICYIPMYGQSYTIANDGKYKITNVFEEGLLMHGKTPLGAGDKILRPLKTNVNTEFIVSNFGNAFIRLVRNHIGDNGEILLQSYGIGSRSVKELQKANGYENPRYHTFETVFEPGVVNAVAAAKAEGKTINCPFILYLQGESDCVESRHSGATYDSQCNGNKNCYKTEFLKLKEQMQDLIMQKTGQRNKPVVFVYNAGNQHFRSSKLGISQAVIELCQEYDDIWSMGPYYQVTSMGAHPSPDGRRWLAQKLAECVYNVLIRGVDNLMYVKKAGVQDNLLTLYIATPVKPLQIDTHTVKAVKNYGFKLYNGIEEIGIRDVIVLGNSIVLVADRDLSVIPSSDLFVSYAANVGYGNIKDSNNFQASENYCSNENGTSHIFYIPVDESGQEYIGRKYPMNNWLPAFGFYVSDL